MAYNKARAEKKWLKWKEAEEKKLRELGVDEETIQRLHTYDWAEFNRERRYLQRQVEAALCGYDFGAGLGNARRGCGIPHGQH
ncbi:hypothetical protein [Neglectibacter timonensis]|uniref:hypothetical protein n=1 Tax=Neglectibacter timonensis TaxID=1776382 RepID=UPI0039945492